MAELTGASALHVCLNGARTRDEHPHLPTTPEALAAAAAEVTALGVPGVHVHPKDASGRDSLRPEHVDPVVETIRAAAPGLWVGVTTGAWAAPDPGERVRLVGEWRSRPDVASVNWHETGAADVADALVDQGTGIEAGLFHEGAVAPWRRWDPQGDRCARIMLELPPEATVQDADGLLALVGEVRSPVLLHGEDASCWPLLRHAVAMGLQTRIGLEDVLVGPDGSSVAGNAELVALARSFGASRP